MDLDEIFLKSYLNEYKEKEKKKILHNQEDRIIAAQKRKKLSIMESFLQKFVNIEIMVHHRDQYTKNNINNDGIKPQKFSFYLVDSSKKWSPGISIFFDHPAEVEIAIPNKPEDEGVIVIKVASQHPDAYILEQKFQTIESACEAIARFLSRCTTQINKETREHNTNKQHVDFTANVPDAPPQEQMTLKKITEIFKSDE